MTWVVRKRRERRQRRSRSTRDPSLSLLSSPPSSMTSWMHSTLVQLRAPYYVNNDTVANGEKCAHCILVKRSTRISRHVVFSVCTFVRWSAAVTCVFQREHPSLHSDSNHTDPSGTSSQERYIYTLFQVHTVFSSTCHPCSRPCWHVNIVIQKCAQFRQLGGLCLSRQHLTTCDQ